VGSSRLVVDSDHPLEVLLWHWGRVGPAAKITIELARELRNLQGIRPIVSAANGSQLAQLAESERTVDLDTVRTFEGDKTTWTGKLRAVTALLGVWQLARDFRRILRERHIDVAICTFQSVWDLAAIPVLRRWPSRFILVLHDAKLHPGDYYPFRASVMRWEIESADALIVLSDHVGRTAQAIYDFPQDRIFTVPHGTLSYGESSVKARTFPYNRPIRLLFFGRILKYKGLGRLLDAYSLLRDRGVPVQLDIVGSGSLSPYKSLLAGLPDVSIINEWVDDEQVALVLARADVMILPYIEASQSGVAACAFTAGIPTVATPVGGLVEQLGYGKTGVIAESAGREDLAAAIQSLIDNPSLYESCSAGALKHAHNELGWPRIAAEVAAIAKEVASRPRRRVRP